MTCSRSVRKCTGAAFEKKKLTICRKTDIITEQIASVAQSVVHLTRNEKVACSSQVTSSKYKASPVGLAFFICTCPESVAMQRGQPVS